MLFPGQGSQSVGMSENLSATEEARKVFGKVKEILDEDPLDLMKDGPKEELNRTENAQLAIFIDSYIRFLILKEEMNRIDCLVGHSLGEYPALVSARSLSFEEGLKLVSLRGRLMEKSNDLGSMIAVLGKRLGEIKEMLEEIENPPVIANRNSPKQIVLSGSEEQLEAAREKLKGKAKAIELDVSGPFHSPFMEGPKKRLAERVEKVEFEDPQYSVFSATSSGLETEGSKLKELLKKQMTSPVNWVEGVNRMSEENIENAVEVGLGDVLCKLVDRSAPDIDTYTYKEVL